jgi:DUF177 domain-containing protein
MTMGLTATRPAGELPARFDAFRLARERGSRTGSVDAASLPRLADRIIETGTPAPVAWSVTGTVDAMGRPALSLRLDGMVTLECQRCLGVLQWPIAQATELVLARDDAEAARLDGEADAEVLVATAPLDPITLVEDELVLTLPFSARHPDDECTAPESGPEAQFSGPK